MAYKFLICIVSFSELFNRHIMLFITSEMLINNQIVFDNLNSHNVY